MEISRWRHQMEIFSALLALCVGNSPVTGEFPSQRPVTRSFDVFFDLRLNNKQLSKHLWGWWFETPSRRHCNGIVLSHSSHCFKKVIVLFIFPETFSAQMVNVQATVNDRCHHQDTWTINGISLGNMNACSLPTHPIFTIWDSYSLKGTISVLTVISLILVGV